MFRSVCEVPVRSKQGHLMADTKLGDQRVNRPDSLASTEGQRPDAGVDE